MIQQRYFPIAMLLTTAILVAGCRDNPSLRKQKYLESGERFSAEGKYKEASIQFLNALKVDGDSPEAHYQLAQAYEHMGQFVAAADELGRTVDADPENLSARIDLGNLLLASGRLSMAQEQAKAVMAKQPDNAAGHALLCAIALRQGKNDIAIAEIKRAIKLDPNRAVFHENLGLLQSDDPAMASSAEAEFRKAVELDPRSLNARLLLASFYVRNSRLVEAEKAAWDAVRTDPGSLTARADVAQIILKEGDWARAEQVLRQASQDFADTIQGATILADYYASTRQFDKARAEFSKQIARSPRNLLLQKRYIRVLIETRDYRTAKPLVAALLKNSPKDPEVTALNGILLLHDGKTNEAANALHDGVGVLPQDDFLQYWLGRAAEEKGEISVAETSFRRAAILNPLAREPLEELARIAAERGDAALLQDVANRAISSLPGIPDGFVWRAIVDIDRNAFIQAEADLNAALKIAPESWQAHLQFGKLRFLQKRYAEGASMLEQALEYNPDSVQALRLLTDYDTFQGHPERAMARINAQIEKSPRNSSFYDLLAQAQFQDNKLEQAAETAQRAIQLNTSDGDAVSLFAQIAVSRGMTAQAIEVWHQWLNSHPNDAGTLAVLGTLEESRGNLEKAESYYRKSLQIQPRQPIAANNLAYHMLQAGETTDVALSLAETARQAMPDSPTTADTLAWAYYHKGTYIFARDLLEDAINIEPDCASMHYHLGMVYYKLNDKRNAVVHLRKALSLARDSQTTKEAKAALQGLG